MILIAVLPLFLFLVGAALSRNPRTAYLAASVASLTAAVAAVASGGSFELTWSAGYGIDIGLRIDPMARVFLLISSIAWLSLSFSAIRSGTSQGARIALGHNLALLGAYLLITAADALLFLAGWELMTIFAFLMIMPRDAQPKAAFRFLAFGELSSVALILGFAVLYATRHTLSLTATGVPAPAVLIFLSLGAIVKMDVLPFHTWMREVYERLPGFVAGVTSVAVTLAGVYALERALAMTAYLRWWDLLLVLVGAVSAFWGALRSTVAKNLRSVPAYSTVEYGGMILCAAGLSAAASAGAGDSLHYLGEFAGAAVILLALAHALAKSLFFVSLGHAADNQPVAGFGALRSIWKTAGRAPAIGLTIAGLSFAAFPPFAGYVAEWMLLETTFQSFRFAAFGERFVASLAGVFLALAIGMIAFTMAKYIGYVVLGNESVTPDEHQSGKSTRSGLLAVVEITLSVLVVGAGIGVPAILLFTGNTGLLSGLLAVPHPLLLVSGIPTFGVLSPTFFAVVILVLTGIPTLVWLKRRRGFRLVEPWSGGREAETNERFTPDAFSQILAHVLRAFHKTRETTVGPHRTLETSDPVEQSYRGLSSLADRIGGILARYFMNGRIHWYVAYILITVAVVLILATV